jgi:ABC-type transport system involved in multi-copper enzyme maturation permease subunit
MKTQINVVFYKMRQSKFMWVSICFMVLLAIWQAYGMIHYDGGSYTGEYFLLMSLSFPGQILFPVAFVTYFIASDFSNRTIVNEISVGYSRASAIFTRIGVVVPTSGVMLFLMMFVGVLIFGFINGFDFRGQWHIYALLMGLYYLTTLALLCLAAFGAILIRRTSVAMAVNLAFSMLFFGSNAAMMDNIVLRYTVFNRMQSRSDVVITLVSAMMTIVIALVGTYLFFRKAEIK